MITSNDGKKAADNYIMPIYAATVLELIKWGAYSDGFYTKEFFDAYSFQITEDAFSLFCDKDKILSFEYGEIGNKLFEVLTKRQEKLHLETLKDAIKSFDQYVPYAEQILNEQEQ